MMQEFWLRKLDGDEMLPEDLQIQWFDYHNTLQNYVGQPCWLRHNDFLWIQYGYSNSLLQGIC